MKMSTSDEEGVGSFNKNNLSEKLDNISDSK